MVYSVYTASALSMNLMDAVNDKYSIIHMLRNDNFISIHARNKA